MVYRPFGTLDNPTKALAAGGTPAYQSFPLTYKGRGIAADWIGWYAGVSPAAGAIDYRPHPLTPPLKGEGKSR